MKKLTTPSHAALRRDICAVLLVGSAGFSAPSFAYLDPSTGGMILSAILGLIATIGLMVKTYWYKLKNMFSGNKTVQTSASASTADDSNKADNSD
tara:strand:+ start:370 stop:654 length:285 start_codon:yes stop_codon:yes gene_type:complete